jgi:translation elongation factor EF-1beta
MNKKQIEVEKSHLKLEKEALDELTKTYEIALNDIKERAKNLKSEEMLESKIRQLNYQNALENQVSGILDVLKTDNTVTINKYLTKAYENGFIGTLYNMQSEEIPIAFGIDEKKVLTSISKKIDDMTFADRVDTNMDDFKKKIKAEITRGIANNSKYNEIARNLDNVTKEGINSSYRICRTEMARISQESKFDCMLRAKENGADIVKQWDSTMDGKTREAHSKLDGQVKELDEPFEIEINGHKVEAMYPCGFGIASMDINCRCVVLERARWAIEDELSGKSTFTKAVRNKDGTVTMNTFNANTYKDFKQKFFKWEEIKEEFAKSVIRNKAGELLLLYHGSPNANIKSFDIGMAGKNVSSGEKGIFFTDNIQFADDFSYERIQTESIFVEKKGAKGKVYEAYLNMEHPLDLTNLTMEDAQKIYEFSEEKMFTPEQLLQLSKKNNQILKTEIEFNKLKEMGYDGLIAKIDDETIEYAVLDPKQIKLLN